MCDYVPCRDGFTLSKACGLPCTGNQCHTPRRVATFPQSMMYSNVDNEFFKSVWVFNPGEVSILIIPYDSPLLDYTGGMPFDVSSDGSLMHLRTYDDNFQAFAKKYNLNVRTWASIFYDSSDDTFTISFHGHYIVLSAIKFFPPKV
ncbi:hypothetical protein FOZ63_019089 [Perkinsus olseni]|uniref:Uncharacterized protein n=1 Tax=Perkinsus olseni TaxID=32597 RepID=A0A7J6RQ64_PEROL|nr:hypothetical protein FOZ63_019089 [Perkinsus olseni]